MKEHSSSHGHQRRGWILEDAELMGRRWTYEGLGLGAGDVKLRVLGTADDQRVAHKSAGLTKSNPGAYAVMNRKRTRAPDKCCEEMLRDAKFGKKEEVLAVFEVAALRGQDARAKGRRAQPAPHRGRRARGPWVSGTR